MLKGIPTVISPELMKVMMEMGHGDEIVISDGNFPAASCAKNILVRCDGHGVPEVLDAILRFLPLDTYTEKPVSLMAVVPGDPVVPVIWEEYKKIIRKNENRDIQIEQVERFDFYERTKKAFAIVATSERAQYANVILRKGVIKE
ncbi:MAG: RbsD/FucU domain-containing protein [Bacillota bacterium]|nr:RbsD/FucU domain-containing protein [Bacillota bacterium]